MSRYETHLISKDKTLLDALEVINNMKMGPLVLFVIDGGQKLVGTLTDGDIRRGLLKGLDVHDKIGDAMHRNFNFLRKGMDDNVVNLHRQREMKMKLVPVLDAEDHIIEIINLEKYRTRLPVDAVLMAGGKGERLGLNHISVTVNYLREQLEEHFSVPRDGVKIATVREPKYLGTIGSIKFVETFYNDTILVMNSDLFTNIDYEDFFLHFQQNDADMSVAAVPYVVKVPYGVFNLEGRNIKGVTEKPTISYYANAGIYLIKKERLELIPENEFFNATDFMDLLIKEGYKVIRYPISGYWIDIGQHDELERAREIAKHIGNL